MNAVFFCYDGVRFEVSAEVVAMFRELAGSVYYFHELEAVLHRLRGTFNGNVDSVRLVVRGSNGFFVDLHNQGEGNRFGLLDHDRTGQLVCRFSDA